MCISENKPEKDPTETLSDDTVISEDHKQEEADQTKMA